MLGWAKCKSRAFISVYIITGIILDAFRLCKYFKIFDECLKKCKGFITTKLLDFVHRPDFYKPENTTFRKLDLFPSSGEGGAPILQKNQKLAFPQAMPEQKKEGKLLVFPVE
jgi:hypothetical protein